MCASRRFAVIAALCVFVTCFHQSGPLLAQGSKSGGGISGYLKNIFSRKKNDPKDCQCQSKNCKHVNASKNTNPALSARSSQVHVAKPTEFGAVSDASHIETPAIADNLSESERQTLFPSEPLNIRLDSVQNTAQNTPSGPMHMPLQDSVQPEQPVQQAIGLSAIQSNQVQPNQPQPPQQPALKEPLLYQFSKNRAANSNDQKPASAQLTNFQTSGSEPLSLQQPIQDGQVSISDSEQTRIVGRRLPHGQLTATERALKLLQELNELRTRYDNTLIYVEKMESELQNKTALIRQMEESISAARVTIEESVAERNELRAELQRVQREFTLYQQQSARMLQAIKVELDDALVREIVDSEGNGT